MITLELPNEAEQRLLSLSEKTGKKLADFVQEAVLAYLEDLEDIEEAQEVMAEIQAGTMYTVSWESVKAKAGV